MSKPEQDRQQWQNRLRSVGFRETGIAYLRERLCQAEPKERVARLIRCLSKYESQRNIAQLLGQNQTWRQQLEFPEMTSNPQIHFLFRAAGNIPNPPTVGENRLYFGCGENFYALQADTGEVIWQRRRPGKSWTAAWLTEDDLYVCSDGRLYNLAPADGAERWVFTVNKTLTAPYADQGRVFVGSEEGTLYALDAEAGRRLWTFNVVRRIAVAPGGWQNRIFAVSQDHSLYAIEMDEGECAWHFTTRGKIYACPYISDEVVYLTAADHKVYALHAGRGRRLWSFTTGGEMRTSPVEKDGLVYAGSHDKHLYVLRARDGQEVWRQRMFGYPSSPSVTSGMVYFSAQGRVYGFSVATHRMRWCFPLGFAVATSPVLGHGRLYVGTLEGRLLCLKFTTQLDEQGAAHMLKQFIESEPETLLA